MLRPDDYTVIGPVPPPLATRDDLLAHLGRPAGPAPDADLLDAKLAAATDRIEGVDSLTGRYFRRRTIVARWWTLDAQLELLGGRISPDDALVCTLKRADGTTVQTIATDSPYPIKGVWRLAADWPDLEPGQYVEATYVLAGETTVPAAVKEATLKLAAQYMQDRAAPTMMAEGEGVRQIEIVRTLGPWAQPQ